MVDHVNIIKNIQVNESLIAYMLITFDTCKLMNQNCGFKMER